MERTLVLVKPDGVVRGLIGETVKRIEQKNMKIVAMKMIQITEDLAKEHYKEHEGKPFFKDLIDYITLAPVVAMVVEGERAIDVMRKIAGKTNPDEASPGSIRGDFGYNTPRFMCNVVHASDSVTSAKREINLFFKKEEILDYSTTVI
ncbi:MAG: nucleoside-diphosphate kinase [Methanomicrobia archaeon]|nr:nucleoside-diphosphate kinase [Methanomicrobia archaeon]RLF94914.1 MAG: nucleoside-diphosphate kinase [Thermococci archaeon]RLG02147.1 MAG: nucleoside-diphosphate kinase [Thermococci archaeon]HEC95920.1 nucleoside-diphosphate kinase [Euryarchaeota archaeon]